ncbi:MAG TPA: serine hydrolase domain-containing protein [Trebonia sp.]|jgi:CubicO group peptidase (beta-lactamase class C family)
MSSGSLHGQLDARFEPLRELIDANLNSGAECGVSLVIDIDGRTVADVHGGFADQARTRPWVPDTIVNVWSTTKTVTSLAVLMLADRGLVDLDAPVARYWPEFAQRGKEGVLVRHLMSHTSGVAGWDKPFAIPDLCDLAHSTNALAAQAPWWEPGTASGYHALNFGHLLGEVVRRVSGKSLTRFVDEEISGPLGADFRIGARPADWPRCAEIIPPPPLPFDLATLDPDSALVKIATGPVADATAPNRAEWRLAEIGAANGHGNARSVARILSAVTLGGASGGVRLLSPETIGHIFREQSNGVDLFLGVPMRFGIGYGLADPVGAPFVPAGRVCFWGGWGGSVIIMDLDRRVTISYMMNKMQPGLVGSEVATPYLDAIYKLLG